MSDKVNKPDFIEVITEIIIYTLAFIVGIAWVCISALGFYILYGG